MDTIELCAVVLTGCGVILTTFLCFELQAREAVHRAWLAHTNKDGQRAAGVVAVSGSQH